MYEIKKEGKQWTVVTKYSGMVQYRSMSKRFCLDWIADNTDSEGWDD